MNKYDDLIYKAAANHGLPQGIIAAICQTESAFNTYAIRYKPDFFTTYVAPCKFNPIPPCSFRTEKRARSMSWGLMQVMGQVARERGFAGPYLSALCEPEIGLDYGCRHIRHLADIYLFEYGWYGVISAYNAGSPMITGGKFNNQGYVDNVSRAMPPGVEGI